MSGSDRGEAFLIGGRLPSIGRLLADRATRYPERPFLIFEHGGTTYAEFYGKARSLAKGLIGLGLEAGAHVAVLMPNCEEAALIFYATHLAGGVAIPINARFKRRELRHVVSHSDACFLFTTQAVRDRVDFVGLLWDSIDGLGQADGQSDLSLAGAPELRRVIVCGGTAPAPALTLDLLLEAGSAVGDGALDGRMASTEPEATAYLLYTSGTTAAPKGCELTHEAVIRSWAAFAEVIGLDGASAIWTPCPFFHIGGIGPIVSALVHGGPVLAMTYFDPAAALEMIAAHKPPHLFPAFPPLTLGVFRHPDFAAADFPFLKTIVNVAPPETQKLIQALLPDGAMVLNDFGMTEGSGIITVTRPEDDPEIRLGSNGRPLPGIQLRIADPATGALVAPATAGEIQFRGVNAFRAYYKDAEATSVAIDADGWVRTGDLGRVDESGCLHFIGRLKDILKVGGENVAPAEIEAHLGTHPAVRMAQVIGRPEDKYGEVAVAFVELLPGASATPEELIGHCVGHLASFKIPREIRFVTEWPMSATKIQKFKLKEMLAGPAAGSTP